MSDALAPESAFIHDLPPRERSLWRFALTLGVGIVVFLLATTFTLVAVGLLYVPLFHWPSPRAPGGLSAMLQRFLGLQGSDGRSLDSALQIIGLAIASNVVPFFAFIGVAVAMGSGSLRAICTAAARFRWRLLLAGFLLASILIGPFMLADQWLDPKAGPPPILSVSPEFGVRIFYAAVCALAFLPAAMGEEILFRGWLLRQMSNVTHRWAPLMLFNGALFAAAHLDFAPEAFLERWIMGAGFTYMALRLGGVEFSSGVHFANNFIIVIFIEPLTLKLSPNTGIDPAALVANVGLLGGYILLAEIVCRWPPMRDWSRAGVALGSFPWRTRAAV